MNTGRSLRGLVAGLLLCMGLLAHAVLAVPTLTARVTDQTATLSEAQVRVLEDKLRRFEADKGPQLAVLLVPSTGDETIEQYSMRVAEHWKLGRRQIDDGALLIVAKDDRTLRIEVGYGLEGALNDAICNRIVNEVIVPRFRAGDFYGGVDAGIDRMIAVANGEPLPEPRQRQTGDDDARQLAPLILLIALLAGPLLRMVFGRLPGAAVAGGIVAVIAWFLLGVLSLALGAGLLAFCSTLLGGGVSHRGNWHSGGGPGGWGSGGFSGGGGGFGGGGASGRW